VAHELANSVANGGISSLRGDSLSNGGKRSIPLFQVLGAFAGAAGGTDDRSALGRTLIQTLHSGNVKVLKMVFMVQAHCHRLLNDSRMIPFSHKLGLAIVIKFNSAMRNTLSTASPAATHPWESQLPPKSHLTFPDLHLGLLLAFVVDAGVNNTELAQHMAVFKWHMKDAQLPAATAALVVKGVVGLIHSARVQVLFAIKLELLELSDFNDVLLRKHSGG
jgi:hypothetical protein